MNYRNLKKINEKESSTRLHIHASWASIRRNRLYYWQETIRSIEFETNSKENLSKCKRIVENIKVTIDKKKFNLWIKGDCQQCGFLFVRRLWHDSRDVGVLFLHFNQPSRRDGSNPRRTGFSGRRMNSFLILKRKKNFFLNSSTYKLRLILRMKTWTNWSISSCL